jgi:protein-L-isoaspartate O-methyltransferase
MLVYLLFVLFIKVALVIFLIYFLYYFNVSFVKGLPYAPSKKKGVGKMVEFANIKPREKMIDLGSGDGRIVIAFAKTRAMAQGVEINKILVWYSRLWVKLLGLAGKANICYGDFWDSDYSKYDIITIFGQPLIMEKLEEKIFNEAKPGARIIVNRFKFPNKTYQKEDNGIYLYIK